LATDANDNVISELRYCEASLWDKSCPLRFTSGMLREGEVRYASGTTPTEYRFTGQFSYESQFGLYYLNARWLDVLRWKN